jgi:hypothetical protein
MAIYEHKEYRVEFTRLISGNPEFELYFRGRHIGFGRVINALDPDTGEGMFFVDYKPFASGGYSLSVDILSFIETSAYQYWKGCV